MSDQRFFVGAMDDNHPSTGHVPTKFLTVRGQSVVDPTPGGWRILSSWVSNGLGRFVAKMSEIGGGAANWLNGHIVQPWNRLWGERSTKIDSSGPRGLSQHNYDNLTKGYADATALQKWLDNFDNGSQSQTPSGRIGDGRGVAD